MSDDFIYEDDIVDPNAKQLFDYNMMDAFDELSFTAKWKKVSEGLKESPDTGAYKWAKFQQKRLLAPLCAVIVPILLIIVVGFLATITPPPQSFIQVTVIEPEPIEELKDIIEEEIIPPDPPEPEDITITDVFSETPYAGADPTEAPGPVTDFSPQPTSFDAVAIIKSPVIMRGIYSGRNPGARGAAIAGNGGGAPGEFAVLRALRWLKKNQNPDGSWNNVKPAMTGLALLTFLAHGETPSSEEFGFAVEQAIKFLLKGQNANGLLGSNYSHPIATYALCEAYGMTQIPDIKYAAEKALEIIVKGQHLSGGWDYNCAQTDRDDTSFMGWCAQALKAGKAAELDVENLDKACKLSIKGFQKNFAGNYDGGGFGYTGPSINSGLSPVGTLCMQLHGASKETEVIGSLKSYEKDAKWQSYDLDNPSVGSASLYYWYYMTQVKFHQGGDQWNTWNKMFSPELVKKQNIIDKEQSGYVDHLGQAHSIGFWDQYKGHGADNNPVFATVLCTLQLEVYYRYLPTFKAVEIDNADVNKPEQDNNGVKIDIQI